MNTRPNDLNNGNAFVVAIHESGHAAIYYAQGRDCNGIDFYVVNEESQQYAGQMWSSYSDDFPPTSEDNWDIGRLEAEIMVLMAGEVAQLEFGLPIEELGVSDDRNRVDRLVGRLVRLQLQPMTEASEELCIEHKAQLQAEVAKSVRENRNGILALATKLMRGGPRCFLEGEEITTILAGTSTIAISDED